MADPKRATVTIAILASTGCSTMLNGRGHQDVFVRSSQPRVQFQVTDAIASDKKGSGVSPVMIPLVRQSDVGPAVYHLHASKPGFSDSDSYLRSVKTRAFKFEEDLCHEWPFYGLGALGGTKLAGASNEAGISMFAGAAAFGVVGCFAAWVDESLGGAYRLQPSVDLTMKSE